MACFGYLSVLLFVIVANYFLIENASANTYNVKALKFDEGNYNTSFWIPKTGRLSDGSKIWVLTSAVQVELHEGVRLLASFQLMSKGAVAVSMSRKPIRDPNKVPEIPDIHYEPGMAVLSRVHNKNKNQVTRCTGHVRSIGPPYNATIDYRIGQFINSSIAGTNFNCLIQLPSLGRKVLSVYLVIFATSNKTVRFQSVSLDVLQPLPSLDANDSMTASNNFTVTKPTYKETSAPETAGQQPTTTVSLGPSATAWSTQNLLDINSTVRPFTTDRSHSVPVTPPTMISFMSSDAATISSTHFQDFTTPQVGNQQTVTTGSTALPSASPSQGLESSTSHQALGSTLAMLSSSSAAWSSTSQRAATVLGSASMTSDTTIDDNGSISASGTFSTPPNMVSSQSPSHQVTGSTLVQPGFLSSTSLGTVTVPGSSSTTTLAFSNSSSVTSSNNSGSTSNIIAITSDGISISTSTSHQVPGSTLAQSVSPSSTNQETATTSQSGDGTTISAPSSGSSTAKRLTNSSSTAPVNPSISTDTVSSMSTSYQVSGGTAASIASQGTTTLPGGVIATSAVSPDATSAPVSSSGVTVSETSTRIATSTSATTKTLSSSNSATGTTSTAANAISSTGNLSPSSTMAQAHSSSQASQGASTTFSGSSVSAANTSTSTTSNSNQPQTTSPTQAGNSNSNRVTTAHSLSAASPQPEPTTRKPRPIAPESTEPTQRESTATQPAGSSGNGNASPSPVSALSAGTASAAPAQGQTASSASSRYRSLSGVTFIIYISYSVVYFVAMIGLFGYMVIFTSATCTN